MRRWRQNCNLRRPHLNQEVRLWATFLGGAPDIFSAGVCFPRSKIDATSQLRQTAASSTTICDAVRLVGEQFLAQPDNVATIRTDIVAIRKVAGLLPRGEFHQLYAIALTGLVEPGM